MTAKKTDQTDKKISGLVLAERLRTVLLCLPEVCFDFILAIEPNTTILTRINYAGDLRIFFLYLAEQENLFQVKSISKISTDDMRLVTASHVERFLDFLSIYEKDETVFENNNSGKKRKLSAIRSFFKYLLKHRYVDALPTDIIDTPKILEKPIVRLDANEVVEMLELIHSSDVQTKKMQQYHAKTQVRDVALIMLLVNTGIRVSECVGIDLDDIDFAHNSFRVTRKGGKVALLYFSDDVASALQAYWEQRKNIQTVAGHENAFFLSLQKRRITAKAVENLVEKYAKAAVPLKKITPHKLRSTFGTALYHATGDIYLVADVLGHRDVNTTRRHYADMSEDNRRRAANAVHYKKEDQ